MIDLAGRVRLVDYVGRPTDTIPDYERVWALQRTLTDGYCLFPTHSLVLPKKLYGAAQQRAEKILNTFRHRDGNLGVMACGLPGSGKSVLMKHTALLSGLPIITMNDDYEGDSSLLIAMGCIKHPCVVLLEEADKTFDTPEKQAILLQLLDSSFPGKFLFLLTANDSSRFTNPLRNRPGRIFYWYTYNGVPLEDIRSMGMDMLTDKSKINTLMTTVMAYGELGMDVILSIIWEINHYPDSTPESIGTTMNLVTEDSVYTAELYINDVLVGRCHSADNPLAESMLSSTEFGAVPGVTRALLRERAGFIPLNRDGKRIVTKKPATTEEETPLYEMRDYFHVGGWYFADDVDQETFSEATPVATRTVTHEAVEVRATVSPEFLYFHNCTREPIPGNYRIVYKKRAIQRGWGF